MGKTTQVDVELDPLQTYQVDGVTIRSSDSVEIPEAQVIFVNDARTVSLVSDGNGEFTSDIVADTYDIYVGAWGFHQLLQENYVVDDNDIITLELDRGYQDDFFFDFNWVVDATAATGNWVREIPEATFAGNGSTVNPGEDVPDDLGELCYFTGNGGGGAGGDDIDGGETVLTSQSMDLTFYTSPVVEFRTWFVNRGGSAGEPGPNDSLHIYINNGTEEVRLETINDDIDVWRPKSSYILKDYITITNDMYMVVRAGDYDNGHITEAGFDQFFVAEGEPSSTGDPIADEILTIVKPNPFNPEIVINLENSFSQGQIEATLYDLQGRAIISQAVNQTKSFVMSTADVQNGMYILVISDGQDQTITKNG